MNRRVFLRSAAAASLRIHASRLLRWRKQTYSQRARRSRPQRPGGRPSALHLLSPLQAPHRPARGQDHLDFHRAYKTDIVKVMNDFDYPKSTTGKWYELKPLDSPYPKQLETLRIIRDKLNGDAYYIDTLYGPYMTAMILFQSQPEYAHLGTSRADTLKIINALHDFQRQHSDQWLPQSTPSRNPPSITSVAPKRSAPPARS